MAKILLYRKDVTTALDTVDGAAPLETTARRVKMVRAFIRPFLPNVLPCRSVVNRFTAPLIGQTDIETLGRTKLEVEAKVLISLTTTGTPNVLIAIAPGRYAMASLERRIEDGMCDLIYSKHGPTEIFSGLSEWMCASRKRFFRLERENGRTRLTIGVPRVRVDFSRSNLSSMLGFYQSSFEAVDGPASFLSDRVSRFDETTESILCTVYGQSACVAFDDYDDLSDASSSTTMGESATMNVETRIVEVASFPISVGVVDVALPQFTIPSSVSTLLFEFYRMTGDKKHACERLALVDGSSVELVMEMY